MLRCTYTIRYTNQWWIQDFPYTIGGVDLVGGALTPEVVTFRKKFYVETKESGPLGGVYRARPLPRSANANYFAI